MQTFLPYSDFLESARALDPIRLGNQRNEGYTLLRANCLGPLCCKECGGRLSFHQGSRYCVVCGISRTKRTGWYCHPACKIWRGYDGALSLYCVAICEEYVRRGYPDEVRSKLQALREEFPERDILHPEAPLPLWIGDEEFHTAHQSNLLRKDPEFYGSVFPSDIPRDLPYFWPT